MSPPTTHHYLALIKLQPKIKFPLLPLLQCLSDLKITNLY